MGPHRRCRNGSSPEYWLPVPTGAVLLGDGSRRQPRLVHSAPLMGHLGICRRLRDLPSSAMAWLGSNRGTRHRLRLRVQPVPTQLLGATLGDPRALGCAALDDSAGGQSRANQVVAAGGTVCRGCCPRGERQRHRVVVGRPRPGDLVGRRCNRKTGGAGGRRSRRCKNWRTHGRCFGLVDRRAPDPGQLRAPDP